MDVNVYTVTGAALLTAIATGIGAVPFAVVKKVSRTNLGLANGLAAGLMLAASGMLLVEGMQYDVWKLLAGTALGAVSIVASRYFLDHERDDLVVGRLRGADALQALLIVGVMTAHSFSEGVGVGVSYGDGGTLGAFITTAIAIHNIPEGLAISLVLVPRGVSVWKAAGWSVFSSLPQPIMALPAFLFVQAFAPFLPVGLGFAAGAMLWMVGRELLPEALDDARPGRPRRLPRHHRHGRLPTVAEGDWVIVGELDDGSCGIAGVRRRPARSEQADHAPGRGTSWRKRPPWLDAEPLLSSSSSLFPHTPSLIQAPPRLPTSKNSTADPT